LSIEKVGKEVKSAFVRKKRMGREMNGGGEKGKSSEKMRRKGRN
jgi:hypothetical protein